MKSSNRIIVLGGGAAGFFAAIHAASLNANAEVILLEKTGKLLSKVRVSGGGRCNVTHDCPDNSQLVRNYPRGEKELRSPFSRFSVKDTIDWFKKRGVELKTEADGRMFPITDSSQTIIDCLLREAEKVGVQIKLNADIRNITCGPEGFFLEAENGGSFHCDKLIVATGGHPKKEAYRWLENAGHTIVPPVPSLFTFNIPNDPITGLMGVSLPFAKVKVKGSKLETEGPILITHWGLSGPVILKASAWGARILNDLQYQFTAIVNWLPRYNEEKLRLIVSQEKEESPSKSVLNNCPFELPKRLWEYLLQKCGITAETRWADLSKKQLNLLNTHLFSDEFNVNGKTTFKEEFVTCGGVDLKEIDLSTMQSKIVPGLFFAGEVMNVDGITGGFNFQNAWSSGFIAAENAAL
jgi:predicted Rossmann fold flavoprotein